MQKCGDVGAHYTDHVLLLVVVVAVVASTVRLLHVVPCTWSAQDTTPLLVHTSHPDTALELTPTGSNMFRDAIAERREILVALYVLDTPCGDAIHLALKPR